jgi:hypothetical protein
MEVQPWKVTNVAPAVMQGSMLSKTPAGFEELLANGLEETQKKLDSRV